MGEGDETRVPRRKKKLLLFVVDAKIVFGEAGGFRAQSGSFSADPNIMTTTTSSFIEPLTANLLTPSGDAAGGGLTSRDGHGQDEGDEGLVGSSNANNPLIKKKPFSNNNHNNNTMIPSASSTMGTTADPVRIFPAKYHLTTEVILPICVSLATFLVGFTVIVTNNPAGYGVVFLSMSFLSGVFAWHTNRTYKRAHETAVFEGRIQEGLFVFPTKDVVVRFNSPTSRVNMEFPAGSISLAQGNDHVGILYLLYTDEDYAKRTFNVDCSRLTDRPSYIARSLNEVLEISRTTSSSSSSVPVPLFGEVSSV